MLAFGGVQANASQDQCTLVWTRPYQKRKLEVTDAKVLDYDLGRIEKKHYLSHGFVFDI